MPSKNFRNNNPGNIRASKFAEKRGAPDSDRDGFANFRTSAEGFRALVELLQGSSYRDLSIAEAITRWAPAADNNVPADYIAYVCRQTALASTQRLGLLPVPDLAAVAWAMAMFEGWKP
jgi:hypothetical protein